MFYFPVMHGEKTVIKMLLRLHGPVLFIISPKSNVMLFYGQNAVTLLNHMYPKPIDKGSKIIEYNENGVQ